MNFTYKAVESITILNCIRRMVESGEYCSDAIKAVLDMPVRAASNIPADEDVPFGKGEEA